MGKTRLQWVKGNRLELTIPLETQLAVGGTVIKEPYIPPTGSEITVTLIGSCNHREYTTVTQTGNVLGIMDNGTLPVDTYAVEVRIVEPGGKKLRSMWKNMLEVSCDNSGKLKEYNEFMGEDGLELEAAVFYSQEGGDITTAVTMAYARVGYYVCSTPASESAKAVEANGYVLGRGGCMKVQMTYRNSSEDTVTLAFGDASAKALYYNGAPVSASNSWEDGETIEVYYDGSVYQSSSVNGGGIPRVVHSSSDRVRAIAPNVMHVWGEVQNLMLTLAAGKAGIVNEYMFQFTCPPTLPTALTIAGNIKWTDDEPLEPEAGYTYQVSIVDNLAVYAGWEAAAQ